MRRAYAAIVDETQSALIRTARRLCGVDEDWAQDLVQEAYVRGYTAYLDGRFAIGSNSRQWLIRILTNGFINDYNKRKHGGVGSEDDTVIVAAEKEGAKNAPRERPEIVVMDSILDETVEAALAQLTPDIRAAILMVDVEGIDYSEAAGSLGITTGTLRTRLSRGRVRLHDLLQDYVRERGLP